MKKVDMSEEAILRRLKTVDRLRELCLALMKAKKVGDENNRIPKEEVVIREPVLSETEIR